MKAGTTPPASRAAGLRTLVVHVLAVAATALVLFWCIGFRGGLAFRSSDKQRIFNVHPPLMLIGLVVIAGEAILAYRTFPASVSRDARKKAHLALHAAGLAVGFVGVYAVFKFHAEAAIPNLYSLHAWVGIATITLYALQWLAGFLAFFFPGAAPETRRSAVPWHAVLGLLVFALAVGNAQLGFLEKLTFLQSARLVGKYGAEALLVNFTAVIVLLLGIAVVIATVNADSTRYTAM
ncbi:probable ascorbate-specific transmembrane electron transporter 2 [Triticum urartu]|uniref:probable ascorbate-specific transmembrane electron transporter 2 n=1 Tax=Triticum urartu TaxID=4572 RepID=UPI002044A820|nr:probable ascorbate-specific transmembrane electron transporter 2 [Triticum urartu]XP_048547821.1 probable ascorbate-specific transmembrane electron transporter 2 [Triticum urartu]